MTFDLREYQRLYQKEWKARRKAEWFADKVCAQCGSAERLEVDHIDPATKVASNIWSWSADRLAAELAKCQALCYQCHKEKTRREQQKEFQHGEYGMYHQRKCRCDECRQANRERARQYA